MDSTVGSPSYLGGISCIGLVGVVEEILPYGVRRFPNGELVQVKRLGSCSEWGIKSLSPVRPLPPHSGTLLPHTKHGS
jgi:hypothetical protein